MHPSAVSVPGFVVQTDDASPITTASVDVPPSHLVLSLRRPPLATTRKAPKQPFTYLPVGAVVHSVDPAEA